MGIGIGNRVLIMENSYYTVISPEGCAAILFRDAARAADAANAMRITAKYLLEFGIVEDIITEPVGGAHRDHTLAAKLFKEKVIKHFDELSGIPSDELKELRYQKFRKIGVFNE